jgi:hypothetical protein
MWDSHFWLSAFVQYSANLSALGASALSLFFVLFLVLFLSRLFSLERKPNFDIIVVGTFTQSPAVRQLGCRIFFFHGIQAKEKWFIRRPVDPESNTCSAGRSLRSPAAFRQAVTGA